MCDIRCLRRKNNTEEWRRETRIEINFVHLCIYASGSTTEKVELQQHHRLIDLSAWRKVLKLGQGIQFLVISKRRIRILK